NTLYAKHFFFSYKYRFVRAIYNAYLGCLDRWIYGGITLCALGVVEIYQSCSSRKRKKIYNRCSIFCFHIISFRSAFQLLYNCSDDNTFSWKLSGKYIGEKYYFNGFVYF